MKVQEAIELINNSDNLYRISDAIELLEGKRELGTRLNVSNHRWFEISESYFQLEDGIIGIRGVSHVYSENMSASDCDTPVQAFEGEVTLSVTYRSKKQ